jgi:hypothetical protein
VTEFRQCWAHDQNGNRCQARASHRGDHYLKIVWSDEQCAGAQPAKPAPVNIPTPPPQVDTTACVACHHRHKGSECKCSCKEFIG